MDILLINVPTCDISNLSLSKKLTAPTPPLGLGYLASALEHEGYSTSIIDMVPEGICKDQLKEIIIREKPLIVGFTTVVSNYTNALKAAKLIKEINGNIWVVFGGPHTTFIAPQTLEHLYVDFVVDGEGEKTIVELARALIDNGLDLESIKGLHYIKEGEYNFTGKRRLICDLDQIAFPARDKFKLDKYILPGTIISSRGCPSNCIFCSANKLYDGTYRARSLDNIFSELTVLKEKHNINEFFIADDSFTVKYSRVKEFCDRIVQENLNYNWVCDSRINTIDEKLIYKMKEAGCNKIQYGVESGVQSILNKINKNIVVENVEKIVKATINNEINVICSFIIGHPYDTVETIEETIFFAKNLRNLSTDKASVKLYFSVLTPLPGTYVYENLDKLEIELLTKKWDNYVFYKPVIRTKYLDETQLYNLYMRAVTT